MKEISKGDLVRFQLNDLTFYGTIISIVDDVCAVAHHSYSTGETKVTQFKKSEITKIGNK